MNIQEIPIGIIGTGGIAQVHLTAYKNRGFNVVAVCDIDENKVKTTSEKFGIRNYFTDFNKLMYVKVMGLS